jgi:hypothetical protein
MKKYAIEWETCYCEDYPESSGVQYVEAENEEQAEKKFNVFHAVILGISEVN